MRPLIWCPVQQEKHNPPVTRFGVFELNRETGELRKQGLRLKLPAQAFHVLELLVEKPGELIGRDELRQKLWPADTFVDFEHSLNATINRVREVLGDSAENSKFIETLPRRGYRFIAPVNRLPGSSLPAPFGRQRWIYAIAIIAAAVVVTIAGLGVYRRLSRSRSLSLENVQITKLTDNGTAVHAGISPDGRYVAYVLRDGEKQGLWLHQLATRTDIQILPPDYGDFLGLTFSPDSNYIYFVRSDKNDSTFGYLYSVPVLGGRVRKLITDVDSPVSFSPSGQEFVYEHFVPPHNDVELKIANADGSGERLFTVIHYASFLGRGPGPDWSPDGRTIAVPVRLQSTASRWVLDTISVADGRIRELYSSSVEYINFGHPVWLPGGDVLLVPHFDSASHRIQLWTISFPDGVARRFTNDLADYDTGDLDITRDGRTVSAIAETGLYNIWVAPAADLSKAKQITSGELPMIWVTEAPDGKLLSVAWDFDLWVMNLDGSQRAPFGDIHGADWPTTCGHFVLFVGSIGGGFLMRVDADGTHATQLVNRNVISPTCSSDGKFVFYVNTDHPQKIWRIPVEGGMPVEIAEILGDNIVDRLSVSPDGTLLAYPYTEYANTVTPGWNLAVISVRGGPPLKTFKVSGGIRNPRWSPNGKGLQYLLIRDKATNIWEQPLAGGEPKQITRFTSGHMFDFNWSSDSMRLVMTRGSISSNVVLLQSLR
jgi:DNA-binding winged helix-turn-helix (wHTH) protein/Tol biopolymer transport system component